jgi:Arc/MetJ-type ribon-helix-helix transcriptional regulator
MLGAAMGKDKVIGAQLPADLSVAIDVYIAQHPDPKPSRSDVLREALRQLVGPTGSVIRKADVDVRWERGGKSPRWR